MLVGANRGRFDSVLYAGKVRSLHKISLRPKITGAGGHDGVPEGFARLGQGDVAGRLDRRLGGVLVRLGGTLGTIGAVALGCELHDCLFFKQ